MSTNRVGIPHVSFLMSLFAFAHFGAFGAASEQFHFPPPGEMWTYSGKNPKYLCNALAQGESNPASQRNRASERVSDSDSVTNESSTVPLWGRPTGGRSLVVERRPSCVQMRKTGCCICYERNSDVSSGISLTYKRTISGRSLTQ